MLMGRLWQFIWDMNQDGIVTFRDIPDWALWLFYYPGDLLVYLILSSPETARFLEMSFYDYGGRSSLVLSAAAWLLVCAVPIVLKRVYLRMRDNSHHRHMQRVGHQEWAERKISHHKHAVKKERHKTPKPAHP